MQRSPLGNQDCSREGGAGGRVDTRCSRWKLRWRVELSVTLLTVELEVLHDLAEGLFVLDDPGYGKHTNTDNIFRAGFEDTFLKRSTDCC